MGQRKIIWLTGRSGAGKSTIADSFHSKMEAQGKKVRIIDGDDIRAIHHRHLGFTEPDIKENNRLIVELCQKCVDDYDYLLVSVITPYEVSRQYARSVLKDLYCEVYVKVSLEAVIERDPKGLYKKALAGEIPNFIGVSAEMPYEIPMNPDVILETESFSVQQCVQQLCDYCVDASKGGSVIHE